jgi:pyrimidine-specific ribonucleoside hydrolase
VVVFVSGSHTNLAEALRLDPGIVEHIKSVEVMGGSLYVPGNIHSDWPENENAVAEWNIWVDPLAAEEVFASGVTIHLAPLDATDQVIFTASDARTWSASAAPEGDLAADLLSWTLASWSTQSVYIWDLVAAIHITDPTLCPAVPLSLDVLTAPGLEQGQMLILEQGQNTLACLKPDAAGMRALAAGVFGR